MNFKTKANQYAICIRNDIATVVYFNFFQYKYISDRKVNIVLEEEEERKHNQYSQIIAYQRVRLEEEENFDF